MMCMSPLSLPRPNGLGSHDRITVPCGKCMACLSNKRAQWSARLEFELKKSTDAYFITLTYSDEDLPFSTESGLPTLKKSDTQNFWKKFRHKVKTKFKYYLVGEYGSNTDRPHYHIILFNTGLTEDKLDQTICDVWNKGHIVIGSVNPASISYVCKYVIERYEDNWGVEPPFATMSKRPAIGADYLKSHRTTHQMDNDGSRMYMQRENGTKTPLPRYYKDKLYSKHVKEIANKRNESRYRALEEQNQSACDRKGENWHKVDVHRKETFNRVTKKQLKQNRKF